MNGTASGLIYLFGDSITQHGYDQSAGFGWVAALSHAYSRKLTVVNGGLSGYSTDKALAVLPRIFPPPSHSEIQLFAVFFGANDSRLPNTTQAPQHVPLDEYKQNLRSIVRHAQVREHQPRILLITPPPIDEVMCEADDRAKGINQVRRKAEVVALYAQGVRDVGDELGVAVLDVWTTFMEHVGWKHKRPLIGSKNVGSSESGLAFLLKDGVHLTADGNRVLYEAFLKKVREEWPGLDPDAMQFELPHWAHEKAWVGVDKHAR